MSDKTLKHIATLGFIGYLPIAPGTWGTGAAMVFIYLLGYLPINQDILLTAIFIPVFLIGISAADATERMLGKDSGHIIIDEFCGSIITILFLPKTLPWLIAGFFVFRFFDVIKPPPVRQVERTVPGGKGVMFDDILAAVYSNICLQIFRLIY
ncbi:MAG: phosphatidylglycerophosphatase A [Nitrospirae bacterium]|nr:phosphatidylglycerophosphatase A [Nitrospirota bacterium]